MLKQFYIARVYIVKEDMVIIYHYIQVAGIWIEGNDNITAYKRSIVVYGKSQHAQFIQPYFGCYDPLSYPLFFPNGEAGWHTKIPRHGVDINEIVNDANDEDHIDEDIVEAEEGLNTINLTFLKYFTYT